MSLIKKEDLIERVERYIIGCPIYGDKIKSFVKEILEAEIKHIPTIEPVRYGEWIYTGEWNLPECSVCRKVAHSALYGDEDAYCPNCGAKMCGDKE